MDKNNSWNCTRNSEGNKCNNKRCIIFDYSGSTSSNGSSRSAKESKFYNSNKSDIKQTA